MQRAERPVGRRITLHVSHDRSVRLLIRSPEHNQRAVRIKQTGISCLKSVVRGRDCELHPLLALLSVLGGVQALGPIGILVGPMVVVFLQVLLQMLHQEVRSFEKRAAKKS